ncbi:hypothetical protein EBR21_10005 [bacterium]|nr:hypothetical protein [bacterium]
MINLKKYSRLKCLDSIPLQRLPGEGSSVGSKMETTLISGRKCGYAGVVFKNTNGDAGLIQGIIYCANPTPAP